MSSRATSSRTDARKLKPCWKDLEVLPQRLVEYRGTQLREFDLDAALARRPALILIDELAHTNAPGLRHPKRWQDVEELLEAGIDVYTTVNVQHLESLNDVVAQITGTIVRETIPDSLLENADEVELIDLSPDDLLKRLQAGKVYIPQQAEQAMKSFFRRGNLMALRELALRRTAERVDEQMQTYRQDKAVAQVWPAGERILVCISPSPLSTRLVRAAKRMAAGLRADWMAVYVETPNAARLSEADRNRVIQTLRLAEQLGAETTTLSGHNVAEEIVSYARKRNVSKIIVGKPIHPTWRDLVFGSVLNTLVRQSGSIDVYAISGEIETPQPTTPQVLQSSIQWALYLRAILIVILCTLLAGRDASLFRRRQPDHGLSGGHRDCGNALRTRPVGCGVVPQRAHLRLFLRHTLLHVRGQRFGIRHHLRRHAAGRAHHQQHDRAHQGAS